MASDESLLEAERLAEGATKLQAFPINLIDVRRNVRLILNEFRRHSFFEEYTVHDFSHCQEMIKLLDWIIPRDTKKNMSSADWLMIVLACYFHDMGLLITRDEFENKDKSDFGKFCQEVLFGGPNGADYEAKVQALPEDQAQRFLYQEFVRAHHGPRIRAWIEGRPVNRIGSADAAIREVQSILSKLPSSFRRDLGLVCESHNLDDLHDLKKYRPSQPYGNSDAETVNLQYSAVLLRTVDLLQITQHRAPAVLYRLINPTDPISQREWAKQNAVTRVRPKVGVNREGMPDIDAPTSSIEVFAEFTNEDGFFGLTSYLSYARDQLRKSNEVVEKSKRLSARAFNFPWRDIDDSQVEAQGFLKETFGFELDQAKILDLLTGHTLYNDSNVVVRELLQNSIDAVRLQALIDKKDSNDVGKIAITWKSDERVLEIFDNGTGMSQEVIEKHLLKVGSSRYQSQQFREAFPNFSSISRFGIGVLSAFMVADTVEIMTSSVDESLAREISLRSVHGKYLIRLLDKDSDPRADAVGPHGTRVRLKFRSSVGRVDILSSVNRWVLFPNCSVTLSIDSGEQISVGYRSPKEALEAIVPSYAHRVMLDSGKIRVVQKVADGLTIAVAQSWSKAYRDWTFATLIEHDDQDDGGDRATICMCVEGIAVEFSTPGFRSTPFLAIANAHGREAPKTNVARSSIEDTNESRELTRKIYQAYVDLVAEEAQRLVDVEKYSLSWATSEVPYLSSPLVDERARVSSQLLRREALEHLPMFLVENHDQRTNISLKDLQQQDAVWTVESELIASAERFVKEVPAAITLRELIEGYQQPSASLPAGLMICNLNFGTLPYRVLQSKFEIVTLSASSVDRRLDIQWAKKGEAPRWLSSRSIADSFDRRVLSYLQSDGRSWGEFAIQLNSIDAKNLEDFDGVMAYGEVLFLARQPLGAFLSELARNNRMKECYIYGRTLGRVLNLARSKMDDQLVEYIENEVLRQCERIGFRLDDTASFIDCVRSSGFIVFDPHERSGRKYEASIVF